MKFSRLLGGLLLIALGVLILLNNFQPGLLDWLTGGGAPWTLFILVPGFAFIIAGLLSGVAGLVIPGFILCGIGGILHYQMLSGNWISWAYLWAFIPASVGLGLIVYSLMERGEKETRITGIWMFIIGSLVGGIPLALYSLGFNELMVFPVLLIGFGLFILIRGFIPKRS